MIPLESDKPGFTYEVCGSGALRKSHKITKPGPPKAGVGRSNRLGRASQNEYLGHLRVAFVLLAQKSRKKFGERSRTPAYEAPASGSACGL